MKILMVQRFDLFTVSCARRVLAMAQELAARSHEIVLTHFPHPERQSELPSLFKTLPEGITYLELERRGGALLKNKKRVLEAARNVELIHLWKCYPDAAIPALWAASKLEKPVHYDWDDYETGVAKEMTGSALVAKTVQIWERWVPRLVDTVSVASKALRDKALACGVSPERIWNVPVGADLECFRPALKEPEGAPCLLYVGQLEVASFAQLAVDAFALLAQDFQEIRLVIIGGGKQLPRVQDRVNELKIGERIQLTGYLEADKIPEMMQKATVALAPFEDNEITRCKSPLKIVEYLAAGLPVVGSSVGEVPRMLEGCGICVSPGSAEAMAEGIRKLLQSPDERRRMRLQARQQAETRYSWSKTVDNLEAAYRCALGNPS